MIRSLLLTFFLCLCATVIESSNVLIVVPTPSVSHQVVFRPLSIELLKRGHKVTFITTDPAYPVGQTPENLTEIDVYDLSYGSWKGQLLYKATTGNEDDTMNIMRTLMPIMSQVFEDQLKSDQVQKIINSTIKPDFDLLIVEAFARHSLIYAHIFKNIPVIQMSSLGGFNYHYDAIGAPSRPPLLYPAPMRQKLNNLNIWHKLKELYNQYLLDSLFEEIEEKDNERLKRIFGDDTPTLHELQNKIDMLLLNVHPIWDQNRPVPPSVKYIGGIHQKSTKELPKDLKSYLDSSKSGVIYISFGTNVSPSSLPPEKIQILVNVFSRLPYDVLWKWDKDELPGRSKNIRISKWLPQSDLLKHPKIKLFITQGGLQSTDEAITAGVPLIGIPMLGDQWYNVEQYVKHKIGLRLDMGTLTEDQFSNGLNAVINNESYRKNVVNLRALMRDEPEPALERAVWWVEHLLRHGGGRHLRAPAANTSWLEYLDAELLAAAAAAALAALALLGAAAHTLIALMKKVMPGKKLKSN